MPPTHQRRTPARLLAIGGLAILFAAALLLCTSSEPAHQRLATRPIAADRPDGAAADPGTPRAIASGSGHAAEPQRRARQPIALEGPQPAPTELLVQGRCLDEDGAPLAAVPVTGHVDPIEAVQRLVYEMPTPEGPLHDAATSGPDGRFELRFDCACPEDLTLSFEPVDRPRWTAGFDLRGREPGTAVAAGDTVLAQGATGYGVLVDHAGWPIRGAQVAALWIGRTHPTGPTIRTLHCETDADGRFRFDAPLSFGLWLFDSPDCRVVNRKVPVRLGPVALVGSRIVDPGEAPIGGRVTDSSGRPLEGVEVFVLPDDAAPPEDESATDRCVTDAEGRFRLRREHSQPDAVRLVASDRQLAHAVWRSEHTIPWGTAEVAIRLPPTPPIVLQVWSAGREREIEEFGLVVDCEDGTGRAISRRVVVPMGRHVGGCNLGRRVAGRVRRRRCDTGGALDPRPGPGDRRRRGHASGRRASACRPAAVTAPPDPLARSPRSRDVPGLRKSANPLS